MKAVILMAGKGSRMAKDYAGPKMLLPIHDKPVLEHTLDNLPKLVKSLVFVVGGPHEKAIRAHFSDGHHKGRPITFARQDAPQGTAHAYWTAQPHVEGRFLALLADDIIGKDSLEVLAKSEECAILARRVPNPENFGVLVTDEEGYLVHTAEKPQEFISDLISTGAMLLDEEFLSTRVPLSPRGEYETPAVLMDLIAKGKRFKVIETDQWVPVNDKSELEKAHEQLLALAQ